MKSFAGAFLLALLAHGGALLARATETAESLRKKANAVPTQLEGSLRLPA